MEGEISGVVWSTERYRGRNDRRLVVEAVFPAQLIERRFLCQIC
ncbi:hypothetical protein OKW42_004618 [Paraburkholderia sp. WC7.3d]